MSYSRNIRAPIIAHDMCGWGIWDEETCVEEPSKSKSRLLLVINTYTLNSRKDAQRYPTKHRSCGKTRQRQSIPRSWDHQFNDQRYEVGLLIVEL